MKRNRRKFLVQTLSGAAYVGFLRNASGDSSPPVPESMTGRVPQAVRSAPAAPSGAPDPLAITDAPGGVTATHLYGGGIPGDTNTALLPWLAWTHKGGDWADADGVLQGGNAFAETQLGRGQTGEVSLDLTTLAQQGRLMEIRLHALDAGTTVQFHARSSGAPPALEVDYADGSRARVTPVAEVAIDPSTVYMLVHKPLFVVDRNRAAYLRFELDDAPVAKASLSLTVAKAWESGRVGVMRFAHEYIPQPASLAPWGGKRLFSSQAFDDAPPYLRKQMQDLDRLKQLSIVKDGGQAMEIALDPRQHNVVSAVVGIWPEATEAWMRYKIKFLAGAERSVHENCKLPGFRTASLPDDAPLMSSSGRPFPAGTCGTLLAGNGRRKVHGNDGWSNRGDNATPRRAPHPLAGRWPMFSYCYHPDQRDDSGDPLQWSEYGYGTLEPERWYTIDQRLRVNTPGQHDGHIEARIDGKLAYLRTTMRFRDPPPYLLSNLGVQTELAIRGMWVCAYHGGRQLPLVRAPFLRWKEFELYRMS